MVKFKGVLIGILIGGLIVGGLIYATPNKMNLRSENKISEEINDNQSINFGSSISSMHAKEIMFEKVPNGKLVKFDFNEDEDVQSYNGTIIKDGAEYEISVDANTGIIIKYDENFETGHKKIDSTEVIDEDKVKSEMLSKTNGGRIIKFGYNTDDGVPSYKGIIVKDNMKYEVFVDAKSGKIIGFNEGIDN